VPEGDSIFRAARTLNQALAGKKVVRFESVLPALTRIDDDHPLRGRTVEHVGSVGKHLLIQFSGELVLRTHMRMNGSWHIYRPGERWRRPRRDMRVVIATDDFEAVGFRIPVAEFLRSESFDFGRTQVGHALGPDLLDPGFDAPEARRRLRARPAAQIAEALLDQRVMAGIGNVYKSETLFLTAVNPFVVVESLNESQIDRIVDTARDLLQRDVTAGVVPMTTYGGLRRTTARDNPAQRLWVYGRARQPCRRCGAPIRARKQGPYARLTYWCPTCQPS
jgi:endonuclease VIII